MQQEARRIAESEEGLGTLPVWDLSDLYPSMDAPEVQRDLGRAEQLAIEFEARWKGGLAEIAAGADGGALLAQAVTQFEELEDLMVEPTAGELGILSDTDVPGRPG